MAKNCHNCKHLDYYEGGYEEGGSGFFCEGRDISTAKKERDLLQKLESDTYRSRWKRCFESKPEGK